ncbi:pyruvate dehydrogenase (acetyl-transferring) E1 component subunit alpha [Acidiferrobacter thiooxydans]|uniref:Pyruvate dehydrogenase E1 component subunit alpha n=1 Tax=Acidiferrobacter thiooxydans TaxID=163359 RepID=A0A368HH45_9GAMM|nr:pyruvate dehydrogenase (acetyl-transferring) E1 component subunit alpha [Acidiferrobacter thiooxydans]MDA8191952.1 pyruvate dehydrogenase (acetyl-transferring) E1 component subunit alpha [Gammaproteobacteria bacterium]RCN56592.1 pyruvate dehydrogenase (acetyl-transferring) E1 component subunit alpha [Acidiferrobacter thiooxydans]UEN99257.1 pyruvate dehydrogenase (acetyl-transferring) E1 component subunit alpha [Acidiferrobacter thiooxydans]
MNASDQKRLLREMIFYRRFEERSFEAYMERKIGGFLHLYSGQEAVATGVLEAARCGHDYVITGYRDHIHAIKAGAPAREVMAELYGKETGSSRGRGGSMHIFDPSVNFMGGYALVGQPFPLAAGLALACKHKGTDQIAICFLGDGANNQGTFHETLNMASLWKLPVLFVCENNLYAIGTRIDRSSAVTDQYKRVVAYNIPSSQHDGQDIDVVMAAAGDAIAHVRAGRGPYFIEFMTYRQRGHSMSDSNAYRSKDEERQWLERDPLKIYGERLKKAGIVTDKDIAAMEKSVLDEIENDIVRFAEESPEPRIEDLNKYCLDDQPDPRWIGPLAQGEQHG